MWGYIFQVFAYILLKLSVWASKQGSPKHISEIFFKISTNTINLLRFASVETKNTVGGFQNSSN